MVLVALIVVVAALIVIIATLIVVGIRQRGENQGRCYQSADLTNAVAKSGKEHLATIGIIGPKSKGSNWNRFAVPYRFYGDA
jgi:hypothetical protein